DLSEKSVQSLAQASKLEAKLGGYLDFEGLSTKPTAPKFSIGNKWKDSASRQDVPGPGSYMARDMGPIVEKISRFRTTSTFSFGSESRHEKLPYSGPGPGAYSPRDLLGSGGPKSSLTPRRKEGNSTGHRQK
ncbi:unnamed protein product, partial [Polarella glacialis]